MKATENDSFEENKSVVALDFEVILSGGKAI